MGKPEDCVNVCVHVKACDVQLGLLKREIAELEDKLRYITIGFTNSQKENYHLKFDLHISRQKSMYDHLTGLLARGEIEGSINHHLNILTRIKDSGPSISKEDTPQIQFSLLAIDIVKFKAINDTFGHPIGDVVLKSFAELLRQYFTRGTDMIGRWGGDEFIVLLSGNVPRLKAERVKEEFIKFLKDFRVLIVDEDKIEHAINLTASVGVSSTSDGHLTMDSLIKAADIKMYRAKRNES